MVGRLKEYKDGSGIQCTSTQGLFQGAQRTKIMGIAGIKTKKKTLGTHRNGSSVADLIIRIQLINKKCEKRSSSYYEWTCDHKLTRWGALIDSWFPSSIITVSKRKSNALLSNENEHRLNYALRRFHFSILYHRRMAREGNRNASANKDLQHAREAYETRTSQKEKHKIE